MGGKGKRKLEQRGKGRSELSAPMRRRWRKRILVGTLLTLLVGGGGGAWFWNGVRATPPEPAPRFNLWASTGRVITLDDYLGKQEVVLFFFMGAG